MSKHIFYRRGFLLFACVFFQVVFQPLSAQSYSDGPIQLQARVREIYVSLFTNNDFTLSIGSLPLGSVSDDEYTFKLYGRDDIDLDGAGYTGGACLQQNFISVPNTTTDFNYTFFNYTYLTPTVPQYLDVNIDAWEDDLPTDFIPVSFLTACGQTTATRTRCNFNGTMSCITFPVPFSESDDIRCNPAVYINNVNYRLGPPCQWYDHGFMSGVCGSTNYYDPHIETFWRYTRGTSCANAITLGTISPGFGIVTHYNSNECYSNNWASSPGNDVFYTFTTTTNVGLTMSLCGSTTWDTYMYLLNGSCTAIASNNDGCGASSIIQYALCTPGTYYIVVDGNTAASMGTFTLSITENPTLVPVANAGLNQSMCVGTSVTIGAPVPYVGGVPAYVMSWSPGATLSSTSIANPLAFPATTTNYVFSVTDGQGCTDTDTMTVTVNPPPVPALGPDINICPGIPVTLTAPVGYLNYFWSTGAIGVNSVNVTAPGSYIVNVIDINGCLGADTVVVNNFSPAVVNLGPDRNICAGSSLTLAAPPGMTGYSWSTGSGASSISVSAAGTYSVTVTDPNGCIIIDGVVIGVDALPTVNLGLDFSLCPGTNALLDAGSGFIGYAWSTGATSSTISVGAGVYSVTVTDTNGCQNTDNITITSFPAPGVALGPDFDFCENTSTTLNGPAGMTSYSWSTGASSASIPIAFPGVYSLTVTNASGCESADTITVGWYSAPALNLGADFVVCTGGPGVVLNAPAGFTTYNWSTGASGTSITVTTGGTYSLTMTDANGCEAIDTVIATLVPAVSISLTDFDICPGATAFIDAGAGYVTYDWSTGSNSQFINANTSGAYTVTVTDVNGCEGTATSNVNVFPAPSVSLGVSPVTLCTGTPVTLDGSGAFTSWDWSNGASTPTISVTAGGDYAVTVTDGNGCEASDTVTVVEFAPPVVNVGPDLTLCNGVTSTLDAGAGFSGYSWSSGASTQTISVGGAVAGTTVYTVTVTDGNGCEGIDDASVTVSVPVTVDLGPPTVALCDSGQIMLDAGPGLVTYAWSTGTSADQYLFVTTPGVYSVTVTNVDGCTGTDVITVTSVGAASANLLGADTTVCENSSILLDAGAGFVSYNWNNGLSPDQYFIIDSTNAGIYEVEATDSSGCRYYDTINVSLVPVPALELGPSQVICPDETITLDAGAGFTSYLWSTGASTQSIVVNAAGQYTVTASNGQCSATDVADISDECGGKLFIPNVFTPNDDGINDFFELNAVNLEMANFWIADRWGKMVFVGMSATDKWDGRVNGNPLPEGVYFMRIVYKFIDETVEHEEDVAITLLR